MEETNMKARTNAELLKDFKTDKIKNANVILELMKRLEVRLNGKFSG